MGLTLTLLLGAESHACQICLPFPTESLADKVLAARHLVLARENPEKPYTLRATKTLVGDPAPALDLFLDSTTKRWLELGADRGVLCAWFSDPGEWRQLARHDEILGPVLRDMLARREDWTKDPDSRIRYFADYLGHDDPLLADLAHLEVGRAPYRQIATYADRVPREKVLEQLAITQRLEWQALYILLLAQSDHPDDRQLIREKFERNARWALSLQTAAWATALIEIDGLKGIDRICQLYLHDVERQPEELAAIHAALMTQGNEGSPELLDPIVAAYARLLERNPALAPDLADDLTRWQRFDHAAAFSRYLTDTTPDLAATARIRGHLRAAAEATAPGPSAQPARLAPIFVIAGGMLLVPLLLAVNGRSKAAQAA